MVHVDIGKAVASGIVSSETLGYYLARTYQFLTGIGINERMLRFRQLSSSERAHYASDCWDVEIESSYGWIECVSCADRSAYDLKQHSAYSGAKLVASRKLSAPRPTKLTEVVLNKPALRKIYKQDLQKLEAYMTNLLEPEKHELKQSLNKDKSLTINTNGCKFDLDSQLVRFEEKVVNVGEEKYIPHVIEPSFGIGRIIHCLLEHSFRVRDQRRTYLHLKPKVAPIKVAVLPLIDNP